MNELKDVLERAERAVASLSPGPAGFERLVDYRKRRHRRSRARAGIVAAVVAAGGVLGGLALVQALRANPMHPAGQVSPSATPTPTPTTAPTGRVAQRTIDGEPAHRVEKFWFGVTEDRSCLRALPLTIGPSWTFRDDGHECVPGLYSNEIHVGVATGTVHRDGDLGPATRFIAVYGVVSAGADRVDVAWSDGAVLSVSPVDGRFLLVRSGTVRLLWAEAFSAHGETLGRVDLG
jgi:hypothetical protein